jgi:hypothetical protein
MQVREHGGGQTTRPRSVVRTGENGFDTAQYTVS